MWILECSQGCYGRKEGQTVALLYPFATSLARGYKGCTRLATTSDKAYQLLAHGHWFSPGTPASSTTKTGPCDIAEILLKVALTTKNQNQNLFTITTNPDTHKQC